MSPLLHSIRTSGFLGPALRLCLAWAFLLGGGAAWAQGEVELPPLPGGVQPEAIRFHQGDRAFSLAEAELDEWTTWALSAWGPFALEHNYHLELAEDGRVLLLTPGRSRPKSLWRLVEKTLARCDALFPAPEGERAPVGPAVEDEPLASGEWRYRWTLDGAPLDSDTAVLLLARDEEEYAQALDRAGRIEPYLQPWLPAAKKLTGVVLERPLFAAWLQRPKGVQEYDLENELVHRLTRLLLVRRFDQQPWWLQSGLAWLVELELQRSVYCFPYRSGFVYTVEHKSWPRLLANLVRDHERELSYDGLVAFSRGSWNEDEALFAWGAVRSIVADHPEALAGILEDLRRLRDEKGVIRDGSNWTRIPDYTPSAEDTRAVLERHLGSEFEQELPRRIAKGLPAAGKDPRDAVRKGR